jgi:hypothetical protein
MTENLKRRDAIKTLAGISGLLMVPGAAFAQLANRGNRLGSSWLYQGRPCVIHQQGSMLLLINEIGSVGSGVWTGANTFTVLGGSGWDAGLTAQVTNHGNTINWSNSTVWIQGPLPRRPKSLEGGWFYQGQPCAIFQEGDQLLLVNEVGSIGSGLWTNNNSFTVIGGGGWDIGLTTHVDGNTINWSNNTVWMRS